MKRIFKYAIWLYSIADEPNSGNKPNNNWKLPSRGLRIKALLLVGVMSVDLIAPFSALALTGGPSQPEVQSFEPVGTTDMVDLFSGDFNYNIPLLDVNGYPINIAYHGGVSGDQESSWVGLGWNINPGTINRNLRGLPDDMNGEEVKKEFYVKDNWTFGISGNVGGEIFGGPLNLNVNVGVKYNSYTGISQSVGAGLSWSMAKSKSGMGVTGSANLNYSDDGGLDVSHNVGLKYSTDVGNNVDFGSSLNVGGTFNSRSGMKQLNMSQSAGFSAKQAAVAPEDNDDLSTDNEDESKGRRQATSGGSVNASSMYAFDSRAYSPNVNMPFGSTNIAINLKGGVDVFGGHGYGGLNGFFSSHKLERTEATKRGYGYMYEQNADSEQKINARDYLLDFYRENDGALAEYTPFLPWSNHTYDMYQVSAQGVGGTYRLFRNDVTLLHDDYTANKSRGGSGGVDLGAGQVLKGGFNGGFNTTEYKAGAWVNNPLTHRIGAVSKAVRFDQNSEPSYEPVYFKNAQETTGQTEEFLDLIGGKNLVAPFTSGHSLLQNMKVKNEGDLQLKSNHGQNAVSQRAIRNQLFTYYTASESDFCLDKQIKYYPTNAAFGSTPMTLERNRYSPDHISEVSVLNTDGSRHVFGIPAYNITQIEKSFRVEAPTTIEEIQKGLVSYTGDLHDSKDNPAGIDNFYNATTTPAYVHSYLLTGVLSPDYVDLTGDGITPDDLGSAVKFNYTLFDDNYHWRVPVTADKAKHNPGMISDPTDDVGNYVYGEKEQWYVHSIEGKTHVAVFKVSGRKDGLGVASNHGGKNVADTVVKLDQIILYSKEDLAANGEDAVPIKTVHFEYNYTLCKTVDGLPNSEANVGKLTLEKIYFTYGNSNKGYLNPYQFEYHNDTTLSYHLNAYDGWGTYTEPIDPTSGEALNAEFPYTSQDQETADKYARQWNLSKITLPSGGEINVTYEADDYAYVQDLAAMSMFKIKNFGRVKADGSFERKNELYSKKALFSYNYVFFDLAETLSGSESENKAILQKKYLEAVLREHKRDKYLQITVFADASGKNFGDYEYVKTYAEPEFLSDGSVNCGVTDGGNTGWVKLKPVSLRDKGGRQVSPVARAAIQFVRSSMPHYANPRSNQKKASEGTKISMGLLGPLLGMMEEIRNQAMGQNLALMHKNICRKIDPNRSWIRLNNPNKRKLGGGHRVKKIELNDNWSEINSEDSESKNATYGQEYIYTKEQNGSTISSGVAIYEPAAIKSENPLTQPFFYDEKNVGAPDNKYMLELPLMEGYMPGASVGYSKVEVKSIEHQDQAPHHRTGSEISEFYTARDFPVIVEHSNIRSKFTKPLGSLFGIKESKEAATGSQGFKIELNDMHGKPWRNWSLDENGNKLSGVEYEYNMEGGKLDNMIPVVSRIDGEIGEQEMGVSVDFNVDTRYKMDKNFMSHFDINLDVSLLGPIPCPIPSIWPSVNRSKTEVRTAVATKVVRKSGILIKTTAYKEGASITTDNLLFDDKTGAVLLTSVENEFGDTLYNFKYPAHWAYDEGMGQAFINWGIELPQLVTNIDDGVKLKSGATVSYDPADYLFPGDVCYMTVNSTDLIDNQIVYVYPSSDDKIQLITTEGKNVNLTLLTHAEQEREFSLRIIKSGRKNMADLDIGSVTTTSNPIVNDGGTLKLDFSNVLSTSAVEYKDHWRTDMSLFNQWSCDTVVNDFYYHVVDMLEELVADSVFDNGFSYKTFGCYPDSFIDFSYMDINVSDEHYFSLLVNLIDLDHKPLHTKLMDIVPFDHEVFIRLDTLKFLHTDFNDLMTHYQGLKTINYYDYALHDTIYIDQFSENPDSFYIGLIDTSAYIYRCKDLINPSLFRYNWDSEDYDDLGIQIALDPTDTLYVYDNNSEQYLPIKDSIILREHIRQGTYKRYLRNQSFTSTSQNVQDIISGGIKDSIVLSNGSFSKEGCEQFEILYPAFQLRLDGLTDFELSYTPCDTPFSCSFDISTNGFLVKEIDEIISTEVTGEQSMNIVAVVEFQFGGFDTIPLSLTTGCGKFTTCEPNCETSHISQLVNPYLTGIKGNWRPYRNWTYVEDRDYDGAMAKPQTDGEFIGYDDFWKFNSSENTFEAEGDGKWVWSAEVTEYSPFGMELENQDALGRYSAATYGYSRTLPTAVGSNAQHRQIWFEGFEEYAYMENIMGNFICPQFTYAYTEGSDLYNSGYLDEYGHTGRTSLRPTADSMIQEILLNPEFDENIHPLVSPNQQYITSESDHLVRFRPTAGRYLVSAWVSETAVIHSLTDADTVYTNAKVKIEVEDNSTNITTYILEPTTDIIEGWQKVQAVVDIPEDSKILRIKYVAENEADCWFDDLRMHPFNGNMKSYVYDHRTLRLMAELDENNYATYYEYDEEGNLVRVKKETERGIKTLQENRKHLKTSIQP